MYRTYSYRCSDCKSETLELYKKSEQPDILDCGSCGSIGTMSEAFGMPAVVGKASFLDGQSRGDGWTLAVESAKMEQQAMRAKKRNKTEEYQELNKESKKLAKIASVSKQKV